MTSANNKSIKKKSIGCKKLLTVSVGILLLISESHGYSAKTPVKTILNQNADIDSGKLEIGSD